MSQVREIVDQIKSVKNTCKITRAMELVAASKMKKAQERMTRSKPYSNKIREVIAHVASCHTEYKHPYLVQRDEIKRVGYIVVSSDRGLCGGLNINLFRKCLTDMKTWHDKNIEIDLCLIGRKAESYFKNVSANLLGTATQLGEKPAIQDLIGVIKIMLDRYDEGEVDAIYIVYNDFINTMIQKPIINQLLPLSTEEDLTQTQTQAGYWDYIYEPDCSRELLTGLLIRYIEAQVYQAVIENIACEQSARMVAMKSATDNAGGIIDELQLAYNKARQANITQEIAEIVGGAAAVE